MELVLLERRFEQPIEFDEIQKLENAGAWSLDTHDVRLLKTFLSKDRRRMLCLYEAPDAAAVRLAEDQAKVPYDRAWTCKVIQSKEPSSDVSAKEYVVAERVFRSPVTEDFVSSALCTGSWCLDLYRLSHVESFLGNDGLKMVCVFRAPDAESVRNFSDRVSVPYTDVWTASLRKT